MSMNDLDLLCRTCDSEVSSFRIGLLSKLQELGGPEVLIGLQKVGVDISGVELNNNWLVFGSFFNFWSGVHM